MPFPAIPNEILAAVAELVDDLADIRRLRLTSRAWAGAAHPHLYRCLLHDPVFGPTEAARTVLARPSLGYAVKELAFRLRDETDQQEIERLLALRANILKITVLRASTPVLVFTALRKAPTSKLASLAVPFLLSIPEDLKAFASYLITEPLGRFLQKFPFLKSEGVLRAKASSCFNSVQTAAAKAYFSQSREAKLSSQPVFHTTPSPHLQLYYTMLPRA